MSANDALERMTNELLLGFTHRDGGQPDINYLRMRDTVE
jgi:hypothetical protein